MSNYHHPLAAVADPGLSKRGRRSSRHPRVCQCIGMRHFRTRPSSWSYLAARKISRWYLKRFKSDGVDRQTNTPTNRRYWKHTSYVRYAIVTRVVITLLRLLRCDATSLESVKRGMYVNKSRWIDTRSKVRHKYNRDTSDDKRVLQSGPKK